MTTAEKITLAVSVAGALGVGALLQAWVTHLLQRNERKINFADKSVQIADSLMTRMEAELTRAQTALTKADQEGGELRAVLGLTDEIDPGDSARVIHAKQKLRSAYQELTEARSNINDVQEIVGEARRTGVAMRFAMITGTRQRGLGRGLGRLIPTVPAPASGSTPPPVDEDIWAEMVRRHDEEQVQTGHEPRDTGRAE